MYEKGTCSMLPCLWQPMASTAFVMSHLWLIIDWKRDQIQYHISSTFDWRIRFLKGGIQKKGNKWILDISFPLHVVRCSSIQQFLEKIMKHSLKFTLNYLSYLPLHMCECMLAYPCIYIYIYIHTYAMCMCEWVCVYRTGPNTQTHTYMYIYVCLCACENR